VRHNPNLNKMYNIFFRIVEFTVCYTSSATCELNITSLTDFISVKIISVSELTIHDVRKYLKISMRMGTKTHSWCNSVFIYNS